jgi:hypothetical protein
MRVVRTLTCTFRLDWLRGDRIRTGLCLGFSDIRGTTRLGQLSAKSRPTSLSRLGLRKVGISALCHVWTAPSWQGVSSRTQHWSVQPCVRPLSAVHMTAGHNALRGSGPGHKLAFDNALALVGCPDRRIDRLCITCCSPSQPSHHPDARCDLVHAASATGSL